MKKYLSVFGSVALWNGTALAAEIHVSGVVQFSREIGDRLSAALSAWMANAEPSDTTATLAGIGMVGFILVKCYRRS